MNSDGRSLPALAVSVTVTLSLIGAGCDGGEDPGDARLQGVVDGMTQDIFVGAGLTGSRQLFHVPGSALTVDPPDGGSRTFVSGTAKLANGASLDDDRIQPIGSNTKVVTAVLVMRLVEKGRLKVDDELPSVAARYKRDHGALAKLVSRYRDRLKDVELGELLNHTSGLADCLDTPGFFKAFGHRPLANYSLARLAGFGLSQPPVFKPGAPGEWNYSNTDYMLLGMVIEAVTGYSVEQEMANLFDQIGMNHTHYAPSVGQLRRQPLEHLLIDGYMPVPPPGTKLPSVFDAFDGVPAARADLNHPRAVDVISTNPSQTGPTVEVSRAGPKRTARVERHTRFKYQNVTDAYSLSIAQSAGGIVTNTADLALFWRRLFDGDLVSEDTLREMERTVPTGENSKGVKTTWGFGFGRQQIAPGVLWKGSPRFTVWMHLGDIFGYESAAYYVPQEDLVVTNTVNAFPLPVGDLGMLRDVLRAETQPD
jgi:CubicO group peptidase (beta-lactamase class C family)